MNWQGNVIVWGSLIFLIALGAGGYILIPSNLGAAMILGAGACGIVWFVMVWQIMMAMGSDR